MNRQRLDTQSEEQKEVAPSPTLLERARGETEEAVATRSLRTVPMATQSVETARTQTHTAAQTLPPLQRQEQALRRKTTRQKRFASGLYVALTGDDHPTDQLAATFEHLAVALRTGMTLPAALESAAQTDNATRRAMCLDLAAQTREGVPLARALERWQRDLPEIVIPILEHGTLYYSLETACTRLTVALKKHAALERRYDYSAMNPAFTLPLIGGLLLLLSLVVIENPVVFGTLSLALFAVSGLLWTKRRQWFGRESTAAWRGRVALGFSTKGYANQAFGSARWARTFATLWECGVPIGTALETAGQASRNPHYRELLQTAAARTHHGLPLSESLAHERLLPPYLLDIVRTGETTGELGPSLDQLADTLEGDARQRAAIVLFTKVFGGMLLVALAMAVVALILLAITILIFNAKPPKL